MSTFRFLHPRIFPKRRLFPEQRLVHAFDARFAIVLHHPSPPPPDARGLPLWLFDTDRAAIQARHPSAARHGATAHEACSVRPRPAP